MGRPVLEHQTALSYPPRSAAVTDLPTTETEIEWCSLLEAIAYLAGKADPRGFYERCRNARSTADSEPIWIGDAKPPPGAVPVEEVHEAFPEGFRKTGYAVFPQGFLLWQTGVVAGEDGAALEKAARELPRLCASGAVASTGRAGFGAIRRPNPALMWHDMLICDFDGRGLEVYDVRKLKFWSGNPPLPAMLDLLFSLTDLRRVRPAPPIGKVDAEPAAKADVEPAAEAGADRPDAKVDAEPTAISPPVKLSPIARKMLERYQNKRPPLSVRAMATELGCSLSPAEKALRELGWTKKRKSKRDA
jgi:hypothetical protein